MLQLPTPNPQSPNRAFTLLEMTVVIAIVALVLGGGIASFLKYTEKKGYQATQEQLAYLQEQLALYVKTYGRLPCPADITDAQSDTNFGIEVGDPGVCETANFQYATDNDVVAGMLPVRALGLADDMAFDSWGSRLLYAVDRRYTENAATVKYRHNNGKLVTYISRDSNNPKASVYILLSHGPNRHGAYPRAGGTIRTAGSVGGGNDEEESNCNCDRDTGVGGGLTVSFYQEDFRDGTNDGDGIFDDIVVFASTNQLFQ